MIPALRSAAMQAWQALPTTFGVGGVPKQPGFEMASNWQLPKWNGAMTATRAAFLGISLATAGVTLPTQADFNPISAAMADDDMGMDNIDPRQPFATKWVEDINNFIGITGGFVGLGAMLLAFVGPEKIAKFFNSGNKPQ